MALPRWIQKPYWEDWGSLIHKNYVLRVFNPCLLPMYTRASFLLLGVGFALSILQARAFIPFSLLILLTLDYKKINWVVVYGGILFALANIAYHFYTLIKVGKLVF